MNNRYIKLSIIIAFLIQLFPAIVLFLWISAANENSSQQESVAQFYSYFPKGLQGTVLTGLCALISAMSGAIALYATRIKQTFWKYLSLAIAIASSMMFLLFLFWLM